MTTNLPPVSPEAAPASLLSPDRRRRDQDVLADRRVDVVVVGGGITGVGVALDAATRGLSVALVEAAGPGLRHQPLVLQLVTPAVFAYLASGKVGVSPGNRPWSGNGSCPRSRRI